MELLDRQPSENARSYALRVLLHNIITLELAPGSAVSENELSQILKLSRTPVREALIELSKMGLVDIQPQRGSYIAKIDYELVEESRFMRLVLENAVLALVCEGISPEHEEMLRANMEEETRHLEAGDYTRLFELDTDFHRLLFTSVGKAQTYSIIHSQMVHFDRLRALSLKSLKPDKIVEDHENILYAIGRRDSELAEMLMTRHLTRHRVEKSELIKLYPDYFV
ncbi:MAG: GntR family transcriptional regulator [Enterocloster aldenensis]|nr:GntR family transcriptional regulator [Enterocloster aldenensis]MDY4529606.1 GntR family transcriptional regulator [Enterocloster aldenensis]